MSNSAGLSGVRAAKFKDDPIDFDPIDFVPENAQIRPYLRAIRDCPQSIALTGGEGDWDGCNLHHRELPVVSVFAAFRWSQRELMVLGRFISEIANPDRAGIRML
jgi:hypothetical protein